MARPEKMLSDAQLAEVETLASVLTAAQMADYFGIGRTTFFAIMARNDDVAERYKKGKARAIGAIAQSLIAKARAGDTASMIFFLKTQGGWRETAVIEHTSPDDPMRDQDDAAKLFIERMARIAERQRDAHLIEGSVRQLSPDAWERGRDGVRPLTPDDDGRNR
jgi:hypothetical protein